jgi:hypothetical protein
VTCISQVGASFIDRHFTFRTGVELRFVLVAVYYFRLGIESTWSRDVFIFSFHRLLHMFDYPTLFTEICFLFIIFKIAFEVGSIIAYSRSYT